MSPKEIQKRNVKAENLRVLQSEDGQFFVESEKGKVLYNVVLGEDSNTCTCGDYAKNIKRDPYFNCKHIQTVKIYTGILMVFPIQITNIWDMG